MAGVPERSPFGVDPSYGGPLAHAQASVLIGAEKAPELEVVIAWQTLQPAFEVAPQHRHATDQDRMSRQAVHSNRQVIGGRRAHEVLPEAGPNPSGPDTFVAGAHRAQVKIADGFKISALSDPAEHAGPVTIDAIPHFLAHEAANLFEAGDPVELGRAHRHLISANLRHQRSAERVDEPWLAGRRADAR